MLPTLLSRCSLTPCLRPAGVGAWCDRIAMSRPIHSDVGSIRNLKPRKRLHITYAEFVRELDSAFKGAKMRENQLRVRADGFVSLGQVINISQRLRPTVMEKDGERLYEPKVTIGQLLNVLQNAGPTLTLLQEPPLHCLGDPNSRPIWWVRRTKLRGVREGIDQAKQRVMPGTSVRNAIYRAKTEDWDHIRVHGLRPPPHQEMIFMSPVDKINEDDVRVASYVYIFIDMEEAMKQGVEFFLTRDLRVVSPGDANGVIRPSLFKDAVRVDTNIKTLRPVAGNACRDDCNSSSEQCYEFQ